MLSSALLCQAVSPLDQGHVTQCLREFCSGLPLATPLPKGREVCQAKRGGGHLELHLPSGTTLAKKHSVMLVMFNICINTVATA